MILMIDNYDSFTYNLVQYLGELGEPNLKVFRNDKITIGKIKKLRPEKIVISPGPGTPDDAGISKELIREFAGKIPILGVCLGHQCIGAAYGGKIIPAKRLMHGKTSLIYHNGQGLFENIPNPFEATRYHSLLVERKSLPSCLSITAWTKEKEIMGLEHKPEGSGLASDSQSHKPEGSGWQPNSQSHKQEPLFGVQFHPESILTRVGKDILKNFLKIN